MKASARTRAGRGRPRVWPTVLVALCLLVAVLGPATASSSSPASAALRLPPRAQGLWDGGDNYEICHGSRYLTRPLDYAIGDIQRRLRTVAQRAAYIQQVNTCTDRRSMVYVRPMHEINGDWTPWSSRTPYEFRRDFCALKRLWKANSTRDQWSRVRWVLGLNHGTSTGRGRPSDYFTPCADLIGVSMYLRLGYTWSFWTGTDIGLTFWQRFAWARKCGSMYRRPQPGEHVHRCNVAASEWGVQNGWRDGRRNDIAGYRSSMIRMTHWAYQAPLCGDGTPWIDPNTGRPCPRKPPTPAPTPTPTPTPAPTPTPLPAPPPNP
jgi:hypothetical protein